MALTDGLLGLYRWNQHPSDASGNGKNGTVYGAVFNTSVKKLGSASIDGDGVDDYVTLSSQPGFGSTSLSLSAWVYLDALYGPGDIAMEIFNNNQIFIRKEPQSDGTRFAIFLKLSDGTIEPRAAWTASFVTGVWYHILATWNGTDLKLYGDGVLKDTVTRLGVLTSITVTAQWLAGEQTTTNNNFFNGKLDECGLWNRVLTAAEISQLYNSGTGIEIPYPTPTGDGGGGIWGLIR